MVPHDSKSDLPLLYYDIIPDPFLGSLRRKTLSAASSSECSTEPSCDPGDWAEVELSIESIGSWYRACPGVNCRFLWHRINCAYEMCPLASAPSCCIKSSTDSSNCNSRHRLCKSPLQRNRERGYFFHILNGHKSAPCIRE